MCESDFSCIKEVVKTVRICLPSRYIINETDGISEILESWKRQYNDQLQGIVASYKDVSFRFSGSRNIDLVRPYARYYVTAKFELLCPSIGSIVKGKINRLSHDYIGCLVHNTVNGVLNLPSKRSREINQFIVLDRLILFQVTCFDFHRKFMRVKGEITEECVNLMKELPEFNVENYFLESSFKCSSSSEFSEDSVGDLMKNPGNNEFECLSPKKIDSDSSSNILSPKNSCNDNLSESFNYPQGNSNMISQKKNISTFGNADEMINVFSLYESNLKDKLACNEGSLSTVKIEPVETNRKSKKRKQESSNNSSSPRKKRKIEDSENISVKSSHKKSKSKKVDKEKSKKDKKKKSKDKSKKKLISFKVKLKKDKKARSEKSKSKKEKSKNKKEKSKNKKKKSKKEKIS